MGRSVPRRPTDGAPHLRKMAGAHVSIDLVRLACRPAGHPGGRRLLGGSRVHAVARRDAQPDFGSDGRDISGRRNGLAVGCTCARPNSHGPARWVQRHRVAGASPRRTHRHFAGRRPRPHCWRKRQFGLRVRGAIRPSERQVHPNGVDGRRPSSPHRHLAGRWPRPHSGRHRCGLQSHNLPRLCRAVRPHDRQVQPNRVHGTSPHRPYRHPAIRRPRSVCRRVRRPG